MSSVMKQEHSLEVEQAQHCRLLVLLASSIGAKLTDKPCRLRMRDMMLSFLVRTAAR
jgi:hypothetical protein